MPPECGLVVGGQCFDDLDDTDDALVDLDSYPSERGLRKWQELLACTNLDLKRRFKTSVQARLKGQ